MVGIIIIVALILLSFFAFLKKKRSKETAEKSQVWRDAEKKRFWLNEAKLWRAEEEIRKKEIANKEGEHRLPDLMEQERLARAKKQREQSLCETGTDYCATIEKLFAEDEVQFGFDAIRSLSLNFVRDLSDDEKEHLFERLCNGVAILETDEELKYYIFAFGKMHKAKLDEAYEELFGVEYFHLDGEEIQIVDWGCGLGLGTVMFIDSLKEYLDFNISIDKVILIEPSRLALERGSLHVLYSLMSDLQNSADIVTINKEVDDVTCEDILLDKDKITIHIFSNILDIEDIDLQQLYETISNSQKGKNYFVCVSPKFPEHMEHRHERLDDFSRYFRLQDTYDLISYRETPIGKYKRFERIFAVDFSERHEPAYSYTLNASSFKSDEPDDLPF